jgi:hypothetical protein
MKLKKLIKYTILTLYIKICSNKPPQVSVLSCLCVTELCIQTQILSLHVYDLKIPTQMCSAKYVKPGGVGY